VILAALIAAVLPFAASAIFIVFMLRDFARLRVASHFRGERADARGSGFLRLLKPEEIASLEAPALGWVSGSLPDPRKEDISESHAQIYWRVAISRLQSMQMAAEVVIVVSTTSLGVVLGIFFPGWISSGFVVSSDSAALLTVAVIATAVLFIAVSVKVSRALKWQEAIEAYSRIGWPTPVREANTRSFFARLFRARRS
jgi:hypothetical protein